MLVEFPIECPELDEILLAELNRIHSCLTARKNFPFKYCQRATFPIAEKTGLYVVGGYFKLDRETDAYGSRTLFPPHWWLEDRANTVIDFTLSQFNPWLNILIPQDLVVATQTDPIYHRYIKPDSEKGKFRVY